MAQVTKSDSPSNMTSTKSDKKLTYVGKGAGIPNIPAMDIELNSETIPVYCQALDCNKKDLEKRLIDSGLYKKAGK